MTNEICHYCGAPCGQSPVYFEGESTGHDYYPFCCQRCKELHVVEFRVALLKFRLSEAEDDLARLLGEGQPNPPPPAYSEVVVEQGRLVIRPAENQHDRGQP